MRIFLLIVLTAISISAQLFALSRGASLLSWRTPLSWGFLKDMLDVALVLLFAWGGWPAAVTALAGIFLHIRVYFWLAIVMVAAITHGVVNTFITFQVQTVFRAIIGALTCLFIYGAVVLIIAVPVIILLHICMERSAVRPQTVHARHATR
jgi:hypothetical protein